MSSLPSFWRRAGEISFAEGEERLLVAGSERSDALKRAPQRVVDFGRFKGGVNFDPRAEIIGRETGGGMRTKTFAEAVEIGGGRR